MKFLKELLRVKQHKCRFNDPLCLAKPRRYGCICGKGGSSEPEKVDPTKEATANLQAQIATMPGAAKVQYDILTDPTYGLTPTTQAYEDTRQSIYPEETKVRNQLVQNILESLQNPNYVTPSEQGYVNQNRDTAQNRLVEAMRDRANLGGTLYGGRSAASEARAVGELQGGFAEQDINRRQTNNLNQSNLALAILQLLYPNSGIQTPQYVNPVVDASTQYSGAVNQANQAATLKAQQEANQSALYQSLFQGLGTAAGGIF